MKNKKLIFKIFLMISILTIMFLHQFSLYVCAQVIDPSNPVSSECFKNTTITPVMDAKIEKGKNLVFCSTFQMAWNKICTDIAEGPLNVIDPPWYVVPLNKLMDQPALLSEDAYFSMAGFNKDNIVEKVNKGLRKKFRHLKEDELVTIGDSLVFPYDILSFSYLYKNLEFIYPFNKTEPLEIKNDGDAINVKTFGFECGYDKKNNAYIEKLISQLRLLCYKKDEGFIIELKTKSTTDEIIISTFKPELTLESTYKNIIERIKESNKSKIEIYPDLIEINPDTMINDKIEKKSMANVSSNGSKKDVIIYRVKTLQIPLIKFNILHRFKDIIGKMLVLSKYPKSNFVKVIQKIDFSLNEKGSKLISYVFIANLTGVILKPQDINLQVTPPFVVLLKSKNMEAPYFMAYIANKELLEITKRKLRKIPIIQMR